MHGGVEIYYEAFGDPDASGTVVFPPVDPIVDGRVWKGQIPYLSHHARVVVLDTRGIRHRVCSPARRTTSTRAQASTT